MTLTIVTVYFTPSWPKKSNAEDIHSMQCATQIGTRLPQKSNSPEATMRQRVFQGQERPDTQEPCSKNWVLAVLQKLLLPRNTVCAVPGLQIQIRAVVSKHTELWWLQDLQGWSILHSAETVGGLQWGLRKLCFLTT